MISGSCVKCEIKVGNSLFISLGTTAREKPSVNYRKHNVMTRALHENMKTWNLISVLHNTVCINFICKMRELDYDIQDLFCSFIP